MAEGVDWFPFDAPRGDDFEVLTATCVEYLREKLQ